MHKLYLYLLAAAVIINCSSAQAQTIVLAKDTPLVPQGWSVANANLEFKKDTSAQLNDDGQVITGVLDADTYLRPAGWRYLINDCYLTTSTNIFGPPFFHHPPVRNNIVLPTYQHLRYKGNTAVTFDANGCVLSGTIDDAATLQLQPDKYGFVTFKAGTRLTFYPAGTVASGTLAKDYRLRPSGWQANINGLAGGFLEFKSGSDIEFTADGLVSTGTLKKAAFWTQPDNTVIQLPKNIPIVFQNGTAKFTAPEEK